MEPDSAPFRRLLLRIMLWSLGIAALGGVLTVLFSGHETAWRVVGTTATTAGAAALMMGMSLLSERQRTRAAGFLGMAAVLAEWLLAQLILWGQFGLRGDYWREEQFGLTMLLGAGSAGGAMVAMILRHHKICRLAGSAAILLTILVTLLWGVGIWWPFNHVDSYRYYHSLDYKFLASAGAVSVMGLLIVLLLLDFSPRRWWIWIPMSCSVATLGIWLAVICFLEPTRSNGTVECLATAGVLGVFCNVIRLVHLRDSQRWVVQATMAAGVLTAILLDALIVLDKRGADTDLLARIGGAAAILTGCGTLSLLILSRLNWHDVRPTEMPLVTELLLTCPLCQKKQKLNMGDSRCAGCGLGFEIKVKEPRCPQCNYLLLMLHSDRCPECGTPVPGCPRGEGGSRTPVETA